MYRYRLDGVASRSIDEGSEVRVVDGSSHRHVVSRLISEEVCELWKFKFLDLRLRDKNS